MPSGQKPKRPERASKSEKFYKKKGGKPEQTDDNVFIFQKKLGKEVKI